VPGGYLRRRDPHHEVGPDTMPVTGLPWRDDFITVLLGLWLVVGLFVDGWAHENLARLETFFTPWHALFYSGYSACAGWVAWLIWRERRAGRAGRAAIPRGYELGVIGVVLFGIGGLGDMGWHLAFGVERSRAALLSPTHLLLFAGMLLLLTSPFRAAWAMPSPGGDAPSLRAFLPALLSLTAGVALSAGMNGYLWAFLDVYHTPAVVAAYERAGSRPLLRLGQDFNLATILLTNLLLLAPVLLLLRRWRPPFGSVAILYTTVATLLAGVVAFRHAEYIAVAALAGIATDGLIRLLRPSAARPAALRLIATCAPLLLWSLYFLATRLRAGEAWAPELWVGITVVAGLSGLGLSLLMVPPRRPGAPPPPDPRVSE
jgi:hypothetical protein